MLRSTAMHCGALLLFASGSAHCADLESVAVNNHILVDQFGYRPGDPKTAVVRTPRAGYDVLNTFAPGDRYEVRDATDGAVMVTGRLQAWNDGATQADSGDAGWWFDFSSLTKPGSYYVYDSAKEVRSVVFPVRQSVYQELLKTAMRMYFYQRAGIPKSALYAGRCWQDEAAYLGPNQDSQAHDITHPTSAAKVRDLSGGWFDAGDTNKYVVFATTPVHQLLMAYQEHPGVFTDDSNIPESGNGVPDILDEVKWETDWLKKMQSPDGSVALKVGATVFAEASPPSADKSARFYVPSCTSSTIVTAGMLAHAAYVFDGVAPLKSEAATLKALALKAWSNYQGIAAKQTACDTGAVKVAKSDLTAESQNAEAVVAAIYLYAATEDERFNAYVKNNYRLLRPYRDVGWIRYESHQGEALLFYTTLPKADPALKRAILADKLNDVLAGHIVYGFNATADLYRNFLADYVWGSNQGRANYGTSNEEVLQYQIAVPNLASYRMRALDTLHYFHGVNPFAKVYLSNVNGIGAASSVRQLFHAWFSSDSPWSDSQLSPCGPAPGFVPGGPNVAAGAQGVAADEVPPSGQPAQKSYKDWNGPDGAWVVNEPGIYYQSAYVQLLAAFAQ